VKSTSGSPVPPVVTASIAPSQTVPQLAFVGVASTVNGTGSVIVTVSIPVQPISSTTVTSYCPALKGPIGLPGITAPPGRVVHVIEI